MDERRLIREGIVSEVNGELMTARVNFEDRDGLVSSELAILSRGASSVCGDYWLPSVGDTAVCLMAANAEESGEGWILGTRWTEPDPPTKSGGRRICFEDGTLIEYDEGKLNVTAANDISISAAGNVYISGAQIHLNME